MKNNQNNKQNQKDKNCSKGCGTNRANKNGEGHDYKTGGNND